MVKIVKTVKTVGTGINILFVLSRHLGLLEIVLDSLQLRCTRVLKLNACRELHMSF